MNLLPTFVLCMLIAIALGALLVPVGSFLLHLLGVLLLAVFP